MLLSMGVCGWRAVCTQTAPEGLWNTNEMGFFRTNIHFADFKKEVEGRGENACKRSGNDAFQPWVETMRYQLQ